eukprot:146425_1
MSDAVTLKMSDAKVNQDMKQFKQLSKKSLIKQCKQYDIKYDGDKEKAINAIYNSKKKQSKNKKEKKNKKSKHQTHRQSTNTIHPTPAIKIKIKKPKHSKKQKNKTPKNKNTKKQKRQNTKKSTLNKTAKSHKEYKTLKTNQSRPTHIKQPSLSQSSTTFETDSGYTITMTTPKLMDKHSSVSSHSSLSDHFVAATLADIASQTLAEIAEDKDDINIYKDINNTVDIINCDYNEHVKSTSIIALTAQAPKMSYDIPNMRAWNTITDMKLALPMKVDNTRQCKLFCGGRELDDNDTLAQLKITDSSKVRLLLSWRYFEPDPNAVDAREIEHIHMDMVKEMKEINNFKIFNGLMDEILKLKYNIELEKNVKMILHEYCICLSGDRTYDRKWTPLHSLCYNYQNDIEMVVNLLREHNIDNNNDDEKEDEKDIHDDDELIKENLYIDAWPHSGYDTPLKMAIQRANPKELPQDEEKRALNEINAIGAIELVEFLLLHGARRRIGLILTNLERTGNDDHTYPFMDDEIRDKLIDILKPYEEEDPWKPGRKLTA